MTPLVAKVLEVAAREIGVRELGRNRGVRVEIYLASVGLGPGSPWCAAFVSFCWIAAARELGIPCPLRPSGGALKLWKLAEPTSRTKEPRLGSIFVIDHGAGLGHTGLVEDVFHDHLQTIEGNTSAGGSREGDGVYRRTRRLVDINVGYVVPGEVQGPALPEGEA